MTGRLLFVVSLVGAVLVFGGVAVTAQGPQPLRPGVAAGTAFTYQGQLKQNGSPVNGSVNMSFKLYYTSTGGLPLGTLTQPVTVVNGLFTTQLDFVLPFDGNAHWLGIAVGTDPELTPRQLLTAVPYALFAEAPWLGNGGSIYYGLGNVGIGTFNPTRRLEVHGIVGLSDLNNFFNAGIATELASQMIELGLNDSASNRFGGDYEPSARGGFMRVDTRAGEPLFTFFGRPAGSTAGVSSLVSISAAGKLTAIGGFNGTCRSDGFVASGPVCNQDVAETFATTERTAPGDLVTLVAQNSSASTVRKANRAYDELLVGVVSQNPGLVFDNGQTHLAGDNSQLITDDKTVVALVGRVLVNVTTENGPIAAGDPLTSASMPGAAMKATHAGKIIGYALEAAEHDGQALVLLQPGTWLPAGELATQTEYAQLKARVASLEEQNATTEPRLSTLERAGTATNTTASPMADANLLGGLLGGGNIGSIGLIGLVVVLLVRDRRR